LEIAEGCKHQKVNDKLPQVAEGEYGCKAKVEILPSQPEVREFCRWFLSGGNRSVVLCPAKHWAWWTGQTPSGEEWDWEKTSGAGKGWWTQWHLQGPHSHPAIL